MAFEPFTDETAKEYALGRIGLFGEILQWDTENSNLGLAIEDALILVGATDLDNVSDWIIYRLALDVAIWRLVTNNTGAIYTFSSDGASYSREQLAKNAEKSLKDAEALFNSFNPVQTAIYIYDSPSTATF